MKIIVLGAGLLGITTAYELGRRGHKVLVLDRQPESARECSFANGGQLSYSHAEPWASPHVLPKIPKWLLDPESPLALCPSAVDWRMISWGLSFLRQCTPARAAENCIHLLRLGLYSRRKMADIRSQTGVVFDHSGKGILHIYGSQADFDYASRHNNFQAKLGGEWKALSREECLRLEPTLAHTERTIVGGFHALFDEGGDPYLFCNALAKVATERHGAVMQYNTDIHSLRTEGGRIAAVVTSRGDFSADAYVMALGAYSAPHLRRIGIRLPIYPMKGYSITIPADGNSPRISSITDGTHKIVYSRLGDRLRISGTAELAGYDQAINPQRIAPIVRAAKTLFPNINWQHEPETWACIRPQTPSGLPILGSTRYENLFLNTGHGTLGWTQAAGSSAIVADIMEGKTPEILTQGLTLEQR